MLQTYGYFEWDLEEAETAKRRPAADVVENLYDREVRIRVGELIARAMRSAEKRKP